MAAKENYNGEDVYSIQFEEHGINPAEVKGEIKLEYTDDEAFLQYSISLDRGYERSGDISPYDGLELFVEDGELVLRAEHDRGDMQSAKVAADFIADLEDTDLSNVLGSRDGMGRTNAGP